MNFPSFLGQPSFTNDPSEWRVSTGRLVAREVLNFGRVRSHYSLKGDMFA